MPSGPNPRLTWIASPCAPAQTLTGLPPSQTELDAFRRDTKPGAYERYVDRLLRKPAYGEHEARYWLDAVRYGDTHGLQLDNERGVYPYRDWVVRAYNEDLPFTKFVEWQLAGRPLAQPYHGATYCHRLRPDESDFLTKAGRSRRSFWPATPFDRVDTTSTVFLGMTVQCAKCHDHKYDPIKQRDYYGLYAFSTAPPKSHWTATNASRLPQCGRQAQSKKRG